MHNHMIMQCQLCEEGVELHAQVCHDSSKGLHQRLEEFIREYRYIKISPSVVHKTNHEETLSPRCRRSPIVMNSPVESGTEKMLNYIQQLRTVITSIQEDSSSQSLSVFPLTMNLNNTLDAAVHGGVSRYEV